MQKYKVKFKKITWTDSGKINTYYVSVKAETEADAVCKVKEKHKGLAFNVEVLGELENAE